MQYISEESKTREVFQKDIEEAFQIRRSTVTQILQLMERDGLIERENVARDARLKKLVLTVKGHEIEGIMKGQISDMEERIVKNISAKEREMLLIVLEKIRKNLE